MRFISGVIGLLVVSSVVIADQTSVVLSETDDGKTIEVNDAKSVVVKLTGNPSTGYTWLVAKVEGTALQQVGGVQYEAGGGPGVVGAGGTFQATFNVTASGEAKIALEYRRSWEKDKAPAKTFSVTLKVKTKDPPTTAPATAPATQAAEDDKVTG